MVTALAPQINAKSGCISQLLASGGAPCTGRCTWQFARADFMAQNLTLHVAKCQTAHCTWELDTDHGKAADSVALNSSLLSPLQRTVEGVCALATGPRRLGSPCLCFGNPIAALCWCKIKPTRFPHPKLLPASHPKLGPASPAPETSLTLVDS